MTREEFISIITHSILILLKLFKALEKNCPCFIHIAHFGARLKDINKNLGTPYFSHAPHVTLTSRVVMSDDLSLYYVKAQFPRNVLYNFAVARGRISKKDIL